MLAERSQSYLNSRTNVRQQQTNDYLTSCQLAQHQRYTGDKQINKCSSKSQYKQGIHYQYSSKYIVESKVPMPHPPFVSIYGQQTRLQTIMKIQVNPIFNQKKHNYSEFNQKQNIRGQSIKRPLSRFQRIMNIKVKKPSIGSTLAHYQPTHASKSNLKPPIKTDQPLSECQKRYHQQIQKKERQHQLWKEQERLRQIQTKKQKLNQEQQYQKQRRKQLQFQHLVSKQLIKIQKNRQITKRQTEGFSKYIYPFS